MKKIIILFLAFFLGTIQLYSQGCATNLTLSTPETVSPVLHQASNKITGVSSYIVNSGYNSTLRAGVLIELRSGTYIRPGSSFLAKIAPCTKSARQQDTTDKFSNNKGVAAYPNPVESILNLSLDHAEMSKVTLATLDGRIVLKQDAGNANSLQLQMSSSSSGIYVLTVETNDGQVFRKKIVKK